MIAKMAHRLQFSFSLFLQILLYFTRLEGAEKQPNIIFILTDDQDTEIGGMLPMNKTRRLIGDEGMTFTNMFVSSPLCCPSRSSILTGNYIHNNGAKNNSISGNCSSRAWQKTAELKTFPVYLKQQNYNTFFAGKYLNRYGESAEVGGVEHVPPGWDQWNALVGNSQYYNYKLSVNGKAEKHGDRYPDDYLTDIIGKRALKFLENQTESSPFFMMLSTPACHGPVVPSPQYNNSFSGTSAPRGGSYNVHNKDAHWLIRAAKNPMSSDTETFIDDWYRNRWRTLQSVDDIVENLIRRLKERDMLQNTYIFYTSDNGFHLGQMSLPFNKMQMYEFDIRVPLLVRGPGIKPGTVRKELVGNIDFAPTFVELSGIAPPAHMDGISLLPLLHGDESRGDYLSFNPHEDGEDHPPSNPTSGWRSEFLVEHQGMVQDKIAGCPNLDHQQVSYCTPDCVCEDSLNNTYSCLRVMEISQNFVFCQFKDSQSFMELYDLDADPHQLSNLAYKVSPEIITELSKRLLRLLHCQGKACHL